MTHIFEALERAGLTDRDGVHADRLAATPAKDLVDLIKLLAEESTPPPPETVHGPLHAATLALAGARTPCSHVDCRLKWSGQLAQFAALYSDRVYAFNFLAEHLHHGYAVGQASEDDLRAKLYDDLVVLESLRPVIDAGLLVLANPPTRYCPYHSAVSLIERAHGSRGRERLEEAEEFLINAYAERSQVTLRSEGVGSFSVRVTGPQDLFEHGVRIRDLRHLPDGISSQPEVLSTLRSHGRVELDETGRRLSEIPEVFAREAIGDLGFELLLAELIGASIVTERALHIELSNSISGRADLERRNKIALDHLTTIVPFTSDVTIEQLIGLREKELDAFLAYRGAINRAIGAYQDEHVDLTEAHARAIYGDLIEPKLASLNQRVEKAKRTALTDTGRRAIAWAGALSFGMYAGLLPSGLVQVAGAVGMTDVLRQLLEGTLRASDVEDQVRDDEMYFLWRVRDLNRNR